MRERLSLERELAQLGMREFEWTVIPEIVGFVFNTNYGLIKPVVEAKQKGVWRSLPRATNHTFGSHGFEVETDDGPQFRRLRIVTLPLKVGSVQFDKTVRSLATFPKQLQEGCAKARPMPRVSVKNNAGKPVTGSPRPFTIPQVVELPIARLPLSNREDPLDGDKFDPKDCSAWAQPLATITVRLAQVGELLNRIEASEGLSMGARAAKKRGLPLSGDRQPGVRMGRRSDALYFARQGVDRIRNELRAWIIHEARRRGPRAGSLTATVSAAALAMLKCCE